MEEEWKPIEEFPQYEISSLGRVLNSRTGTILGFGCTQQGNPYARLSDRGIQNVREVAILVAKAFLPPPPHAHFSTPVHLDGDRTNNTASNLAWRPRWFAVKYHRQFQQNRHHDERRPVVEINTDVAYDNIWHAARSLGLLETDVFLSIVNNTTAFPFGYMFAFLEGSE